MDKTKNKSPLDTAVFIPDIIRKDTTHIIEIEKPKTFLIVEEMPEFPGGEKARLRYLADNVNYPLLARQTGIQGTVHVTFVVDETGKVVDVKIERGIGGGCDEEAARVINQMPKWKPGRQNGREVRVQFTFPINFKLI